MHTPALAAWLILLLAAAGCAQPRPADEPPAAPRTNATEHAGKPRVILVSLDGFRWDFLDRFDAPGLRSLGESGARAERLLPAFPTLTFPNHYSIATGLSPGRHGIVGNRFLDRAEGRGYSFRDRTDVEDGTWYGGEPIWVTAEKQGMTTAAYFFVGTEADVAGVRPTRWHRFSLDVPATERVDTALAWLAEPEATRPHLVLLYFERVDAAGHIHGTDAPETAAAVRDVDALIQRLTQGIAELPDGQNTYLVVVSDHGLRDLEPAAPFVVDHVVDLTGSDYVAGGSFMFLYLADPAAAASVRDRVNAAWDHGRAYLPPDLPAAWQAREHPRFGDVILVADPGHRVVPAIRAAQPVDAAGHGWAPEDPAMHGILLMAGPGIPPGTRLPAVDSVDLYPLLARMLGLQPAAGLDADPVALESLPATLPVQSRP
jgi:predicted AlkP superfamily pyrophosphatase or phosphodiesterase